LTDDDVLVLELIDENPFHGRAQRLVLIHLPDRQIFPYPVDLDRLKHEMNGRSAEQTTAPHNEAQLETPRQIKLSE
jgi:hypothetical protein